MLFNYENCQCCKKEGINIKILLSNILPAGICEEICSYNLYCSKCLDLNEKEKGYTDFNYHFDFHKHFRLTTTEKPIDFFKTRMTTPIYISHTYIQAFKWKHVEASNNKGGHPIVELCC